MSNKTLTAILVGFVSIGALHAAAPAPGSGPVKLWNDKAKDGQWRPFGNGMEDTTPASDGQGLALIVDWTEATWGVGAIYEKTPEITGAISLPDVAKFHKLRFDVRCAQADQTTLQVELADTAEEKDFRAAGKTGTPVTSAWQTIEVDLDHDFPGMDASKYPADAIRILFLNTSKKGKNTLEFRNVTLIP